MMETLTCAIENCEKARAKGRRICAMHYYRKSTHGSYDLPPKRQPNYEELFWSRVDFLSSDHGCWLWLAARSDTGYGWFRNSSAHRWAYTNVCGPIPDGLQLDHLCRNRRCVNPSHLEAVTSRVNNLRSLSQSGIHARKRFCLRGHDLTDPANLLHVPSRPTHRRCKECVNIRQRKLRASA